ncbi:hypothetical protein [Chryseobacterium herbae]|uniref:Uncharacterized protein n=1 Tax=Chryseobacterium herbae TaxID=2976476 RepID=A0ABT2ISS2_9FLAO|nr:hypothetical protein [Chryseobacterium sp. pc1-10]MCT2561873.1 hypothetical protein [Chryseobacterium sp. pc1-10]
MMNQIFSLHSLGVRRFFLFILLLINFQIMQAVCIHNEAPLSDAPSTSNIIVVSGGTIISGMEQIYVSPPKKEKIEKILKRKNTLVSHKRKYKKRQALSQIVKKNNKSPLIFSKNIQSEKFLLVGSDNNKQIVRPNQQKVKFTLFGSENMIPVPVCLLDIFLKRIYKNRGASHLKLFRNFKRPPPFLCMAIAKKIIG